MLPPRVETAAAVPCPQCDESISGNARVCPHCRQSTLVDVRTTQPVADPKARYQAARAVAGFQEGATIGAIQTSLGIAGGRVLRGVTPGVAAAASAALAKLNVPTDTALATTARVRGADGGGGFAPRALRIVGVALVVAVLIWLVPALKIGRHPKPVPVTTAVAAPAAPAAFTTAEIAKRSLPSTVSIHAGNSLGSGFFITNDRVLTNRHVVGDESSVKVLFGDGHEAPGQVVRTMAVFDLAVVQVAGAAAQPLPLGDVGTLSVGDKVVFVGCPLGLDFSVGEATVASLSHAVLGLPYVQLDGKLNPGNSGGPIIDSQGRVVGVVTLKLRDAEGIAFALPINFAYAGPLQLVPPPRLPANDGFEKMLAKAAEDILKIKGQIAETMMRPVPVDAHWDQYGRLVVAIVRPARAKPRFEEVSFKMRAADSDVVRCSLTGDINDWKEVEQKTGYDPRVQAWLDKIGVGDVRLYRGETALQWDTCARDAVRAGAVEMELEGGDPAASRFRLR